MWPKQTTWCKQEDEGPSTPFRPGSCTPEIVWNDGKIPNIFVTPEAYNDMFIIIDEAKEEVSWLGRVDKLGDDFLIREIMLPEQECSAASTSMTENGLAKLANEILTRPDGMEVWNNIRFWGHSHVRMDVFASSTDDSQMGLFREQVKNGWFIRGIFNKNGNAKFWLFHLDTGLVISDVPWGIYSPVSDGERRAMWRSQIQQKVKTYAPAYAYNYGYGGFGLNFDDRDLPRGNDRDMPHGAPDFSYLEEDEDASRQSTPLYGVQCRRVPQKGGHHRRGRGREQASSGLSEARDTGDEGMGF